ncbi:hypothetical protein [Streptomyces sp. BK340]|uniref:hypothetical protein n=1 Tax=Streptomyces sp. BK340 TaxID=2572903 RepID=UPI0011A9FC65|nr:hypothetical protein [Streptomyces sp. BK340]TVZ96501.1 hypothetical protein FB157_103412 [Streptomyces sp. BK340]
MSETVQQLTNEQVAALRQQLNNRPVQALGTILSGDPLPPLPPCPACGAAAERIDQRVEAPAFGVYETALRLRWLPCGHRFRAVADLDAGPVRPEEDPT